MKTEKQTIGAIPALLWGESSDKIYIYVHGKLGCKEEAESFAQIACAKGWQVLSFDLPGHGERKQELDRFVPWCVIPELEEVLQYVSEGRSHTGLFANSIGAWFSLLSFGDKPLEKALFVSPVLDMEELIRNMMQWASVSPELLEEKREIPTTFGETLSWEYYTYAKEHPIKKWDCPTEILYAGKDNMTKRSTVDAFVKRFLCGLTVMEDGEHWFHTKEQLALLEKWARKYIA